MQHLMECNFPLIRIRTCCYVVSLVSAVWYLGGCNPNLPPTIPIASDVAALQVDSGPGDFDTRTINDPAVIQRLIAFVDARSKSWEKPRGTLPTPRYRVFLDGNYSGGSNGGRATVLSGQVIVFLGENWMAAREVWEYSSKTRICALSAEELAEVRDILDIPQ